MFLALVTDKGSRKIVGYHCAENLAPPAKRNGERLVKRRESRTTDKNSPGLDQPANQEDGGFVSIICIWRGNKSRSI